MLLTIIAWVIAAPLLILLSVLLAELLIGCLPGIQSGATLAQGRRAAILMPAHNESTGIAHYIAALKPQLGALTQLVVIADNCSDDTAQVARDAGATVIERHDATLRGKGHALAFGRDWLMQDAPDCVVVLDADCELEGDSLNQLVNHCLIANRPVQSCYLLRSRSDDSAMVQISNFAFLIKNLVRQRGAARLGAPAVLGGTGMAFPWPLFEKAPLATSHLVEDLVLGIDFARAGHAPLFVETAHTWSDPANQAATRTQRTRWEHGFIQTATGQALPLLLDGLKSGRWALIWMGLSLMVPPLALLMMLSLAGLGVTTLAIVLGASPWPAASLFLALALTAVGLVIAWAKDGHRAVSAGTLLRIPLYLLWKLPVYLKLVRGKQAEWVRTERTGE